MEEKLEMFDEKVNKETENLISLLGFEIKEEMTPQDWYELQQGMAEKGYSLTTKESQEGSIYRVIIQLSLSLELNLED